MMHFLAIVIGLVLIVGCCHRFTREQVIIPAACTAVFLVIAYFAGGFVMAMLFGVDILGSKS